MFFLNKRKKQRRGLLSFPLLLQKVTRKFFYRTNDLHFCFVCSLRNSRNKQIKHFALRIKKKLALLLFPAGVAAVPPGFVPAPGYVLRIERRSTHRCSGDR